MDNAASRVLKFVLLSFLLYLGLSIILSLTGYDKGFFNNINLVSEIFIEKKSSTKTIAKDTIKTTTVAEGQKTFELFEQGKTITSFSQDNTAVALPLLVQKLRELKSGKKRKVRIAYLGDSMIEGDLMTLTIRKLLQNNFGGAGIGYIPIKTPSSKFNLSANTYCSSGWKVESFKTKPQSDLFLSGYCYYPFSDDEFSLTDRTIKDSNAIVTKYIFTGSSSTVKAIMAMNDSIILTENNRFNKIALYSDRGHKLNLSSPSGNFPIFGVSMESETGVIVDNFSFRGITGIELNQLQPEMLKEIAEKNHYDLIVFQYGVNMLFRPNDKNFSWYKKSFAPVIKKFKSCFPDAEFLLISSADRAFRYNGIYESAVGVDSLVKTQAELAFENKICFYNQFQTMGGRGSIVNWADSTPSLANKDYVHPNLRGAEKLGTYLFEAIMKDYNNYMKTQP